MTSFKTKFCLVNFIILYAGSVLVSSDVKFHNEEKISLSSYFASKTISNNVNKSIAKLLLTQKYIEDVLNGDATKLEKSFNLFIKVLDDSLEYLQKQKVEARDSDSSKLAGTVNANKREFQIAVIALRKIEKQTEGWLLTPQKNI